MTPVNKKFYIFLFIVAFGYGHEYALDFPIPTKVTTKEWKGVDTTKFLNELRYGE